MKKFAFLSTLFLLLTTAISVAQRADSAQTLSTKSATQTSPTQKKVAAIQVQANNNTADITVTSTMDDSDDLSIDSAQITSAFNVGQQLFADNNISSIINEAAGGIGIAILAIFGIFFMPFIAIILIIFIVIYNNRKKQKARYELLQHAIEKGIQIPADLLNDVKKMAKPKLEAGIEQMGLGFGLGLFLWFWSNEIGLAAIGAILFFVGLGKIVSHYLTKDEQQSSVCEITPNAPQTVDSTNKDSQEKSISKDNDPVNPSPKSAE